MRITYLINHSFYGHFSDSTIGYHHSIVKTQVTQSNSKSLWTIFLQISEMIDMVKLV